MYVHVSTQKPEKKVNLDWCHLVVRAKTINRNSILHCKIGSYYSSVAQQNFRPRDNNMYVTTSL